MSNEQKVASNEQKVKRNEQRGKSSASNIIKKDNRIF